MEKRIYGKNYKIVLDEENRVVWGCGQVPFDVYKPHPALHYVNDRGQFHFTIDKEVWPEDERGVQRWGQLKFVKGLNWIMAAYNQGVLYSRFWRAND